MGLLLWQTVDDKFSICTILAAFKNGIEIFFSLDTIAFSQTPTPSFKFILLYHNFKKNQRPSGPWLKPSPVPSKRLGEEMLDDGQDDGQAINEVQADMSKDRIIQ